MPYTFTLSDNDHTTLKWLTDRGYDADIYDLADHTYDMDTDTWKLELSEPAAWEVQDNICEGFLTCCGSETLAKTLNTFIESIV
jgi:hypothetical protein